MTTEIEEERRQYLEMTLNLQKPLHDFAAKGAVFFDKINEKLDEIQTPTEEDHQPDNKFERIIKKNNGYVTKKINNITSIVGDNFKSSLNSIIDDIDGIAPVLNGAKFIKSEVDEIRKPKAKQASFEKREIISNNTNTNNTSKFKSVSSNTKTEKEKTEKEKLLVAKDRNDTKTFREREITHNQKAEKFFDWYKQIKLVSLAVNSGLTSIMGLIKPILTGLSAVLGAISIKKLITAFDGFRDSLKGMAKTISDAIEKSFKNIKDKFLPDKGKGKPAPDTDNKGKGKDKFKRAGSNTTNTTTHTGTTNTTTNTNTSTNKSKNVFSRGLNGVKKLVPKLAPIIGVSTGPVGATLGAVVAFNSSDKVLLDSQGNEVVNHSIFDNMRADDNSTSTQIHHNMERARKANHEATQREKQSAHDNMVTTMSNMMVNSNNTNTTHIHNDSFMYSPEFDMPNKGATGR